MSGARVCFLIFIFLLGSCEKYEWNNPLDPRTETDPENWLPGLINVSTVNDQNVDIRWQSVEDRITGYRIYRSINNSPFQHLIDVDTITNYTDTGLLVDNFYFYKVSAIAGENESIQRKSKLVRTSFHIPMSLECLALSDEVMRIALTIADSTIDQYNIEQFELKRTSSVGLVEQYTYTVDSPCVVYDSTVVLGETYQYRATIVNSLNRSNSVVSDSLTITFPAPTELTARSTSPLDIELTWVDHSAFEDGFLIERDDGFGYEFIAELAPDTETFLDHVQNHGDTHDYRVSAFTESNGSDYSSVSILNTIRTPVEFRVAKIDSSINELSWGDVNTYGVLIQVERDSGDGFVVLDNIDASVGLYFDYGIDNISFNHSYRLTARSGVYQSSYTPTVTIINYMTDIEGNRYEILKIGNQYWMAENLRVTRYGNNTLIPTDLDNDAWISTSTGAYCNVYDNENYTTSFGKLYNWYAMNDPRGLVPEGWHIPSTGEWQEMVDFIGGEDGAGIKLKSRNWWYQNGNGTNEIGFDAHPAGHRRFSDGIYRSFLLDTWYWTTYLSPSGLPRVWMLSYNSDDFISYGVISKSNGMSIRCVKDSD